MGILQDLKDIIKDTSTIVLKPIGYTVKATKVVVKTAKEAIEITERTIKGGW